MFNGFSEQTLEYFWGAKLDNSKAYYESHKEIYQNYVKEPLTLLHQALTPIAQQIDADIYTKPARCISRAFNDFRYSGKIYPIKSHMHLHFCANVAHEEEDTPCLFFTGSYDGWDCGFFVHHATNAGMQAFREAILADIPAFSTMLESVHSKADIRLMGENYKRDHYPNIPSPIKDYLNKKRFYLAIEGPSDDASYYNATLAEKIADTWLRVAPIYHFYDKTLKKKSGCQQ